MSLLDDVSIVVTPNGYKAGELYAVIPSNGDASIDNVSVKEYTSADMDVTRATAATRVDENGLVNYAEILGSEEITNGDFATDSDWNKGTGWAIGVDKAIYTGTANSNLEQGSILNSGINYILNYEVISSTLSGGIVKLSGETASAQNVLSQVAGTHSLIFTANGSSPEDFKIRIVVNTSGSYEITNISVKEVTRDNVPRIDYTGGGCPHILAEPQRTNLITYSEDFSNAIWQKQTGIVPTYNTTETLSPDGTNNATKFIGTGSTGVFKSSVSVSGNITRSVYLKSVSGTTTAVFKDPNATGGATPVNLTITNDWQRFELTGDNGTAFQGLWIDDITSDGLYMWGAQLEEGSYATSYIPTSGSTVTRNQDIFTRDGIGSLINSTEGVLFVEMAALANDLTFEGISISDGTTSNRVVIFSKFNNLNTVLGRVTSSGVNVLNTSVSITDITSFNKIAIKYKVNDFALWINGVEVATSSSGAIPIGLNQLYFSTSGGGVGSDFFGKVKQLQVYNTALTDTQLAALTS